eukprot:TRINITY_DN73598_c0_g1_i1.p1 TRINITY_DN73598_c0_g1~~TRINITY_DN73598_c0_g1_i1.p1  ORF type:complete len:1524 (-),score=152.85 TRINITY_DN73598_c0_g1_i1:153-4460(-)
MLASEVFKSQVGGDDGIESKGIVSSEVLAASDRQYTVLGLKAGANYRFKLRTFLASGRPQDTPWVSALAAGVPAAMQPPVQDLGLSSLTSVFLKWEAPDMNFGVPVGYEIFGGEVADFSSANSLPCIVLSQTPGCCSALPSTTTSTTSFATSFLSAATAPDLSNVTDSSAFITELGKCRHNHAYGGSCDCGQSESASECFATASETVHEPLCVEFGIENQQCYGFYASAATPTGCPLACIPVAGISNVGRYVGDGTWQHVSLFHIQKWIRIFYCTGQTSTQRLAYSASWIQTLAVHATQIKICTLGSSIDCVTSSPETFPIVMLRHGDRISHSASNGCDATCVTSTWEGPPTMLDSLRSSSGGASADALLGKTLFFDGLGSDSGSGLHLGVDDGDPCGWSAAASNEIEVLIDQPSQAPCAPGWQLVGGRCYLSSFHDLPWSACEAHCVSHAAGMLCLHDDAQSVWLAAASARSPWLGLSNVHDRSSWAWNVGCISDYTNWNLNQPSNDTDDRYAALSASGHFDAADGSKSRACWCQYSPETPHNVAIGKDSELSTPSGSISSASRCNDGLSHTDCLSAASSFTQWWRVSLAGLHQVTKIHVYMRFSAHGISPFGGAVTLHRSADCVDSPLASYHLLGRTLLHNFDGLDVRMVGCVQVSFMDAVLSLSEVEVYGTREAQSLSTYLLALPSVRRYGEATLVGEWCGIEPSAGNTLLYGRHHGTVTSHNIDGACVTNFDGDGYVAIDGHLGLGQHLTFATWLIWTTGAKPFSWIASQGPSQAESFRFGLEFERCDPLRHHQSLPCFSATVTLIDGTGCNVLAGQIERDKWTYVAIVFNSSTLAIFVDGVQADETQCAGRRTEMMPHSHPLLLGAVGGDSSHFQGFMKQIRLYGVALSEDAIKHVMAGGEVGTVHLINYADPFCSVPDIAGGDVEMWSILSTCIRTAPNGNWSKSLQVSCQRGLSAALTIWSSSDCSGNHSDVSLNWAEWESFRSGRCTVLHGRSVRLADPLPALAIGYDCMPCSARCATCSPDNADVCLSCQPGFTEPPGCKVHCAEPCTYGSARYVPHASGCAVGGLQEGVNYQFRVRAINEYGVGPLSKAASTWAGTLPFVSRPELETSSLENCSLTWRWAAARDMSTAIHNYSLRVETCSNENSSFVVELPGQVDGSPVATMATVDSLTWPWLVRDGFYRAAVLAKSLAGPSGWSEWSACLSCLSRPSKPGHPFRDPDEPVVAGQIAVAWDPVLNASQTGGDDPVDGSVWYELWGRPATVAGTVPLKTWRLLFHSPSHDETGHLSQAAYVVGTYPETSLGATWEFRVRIINDVGSRSLASDFSDVSTLFSGSLPGPLASPPVLDFDRSGRLRVAWSPPRETAGVTQLLRYEVRCGSVAEPWEHVPNFRTRYVVRKTLSRGAIVCDVRAVNAVGPGPPARGHAVIV